MSSASESEVSGPSTRYGFLSNLCSLGLRPLILTGFFRDYLIRHFAETSQIEEPDLRGFVWSDDSRTNILIESLHRWRPDVNELRPAILIKRNAYGVRDTGIVANSLGTDDRGDSHYLDFVLGSHTLFCTAAGEGGGAAVELLATEVYRKLRHFSPVIRASLNLMRIRVTDVGPISRVKESTDRLVVPITVAWAYQDQWGIRQEALPLARVSWTRLTEF